MPSASDEKARLQMVMERHIEHLKDLDTALVNIEEENRNDDVARQVEDYENAMMVNPTEIAAEVALDNIIRLQNQLKIVRRRNQLLAQENIFDEKRLRDRAKTLVRTSEDVEQISAATGWNGESGEKDFDKIHDCKSSVHQIVLRIAEVCAELKTAKKIIRKKEDAIVKLSTKINANRARETHLNDIYNDIRVKQRDSRELQAKLDRMSAEDKKVDAALGLLQETNDTAINSVACIEADKNFLQAAVRELKLTVRRQDNVVRAQMARQAQLQKRLDIVMKSLREMKLEKEFERKVSKPSLVPSAALQEPEDVSQILPEDECIPVDIYRLLYKNNEMVRTSVARKNMLVLEKESVIQAVEHKLVTYIDQHNNAARLDDSQRYKKSEQISSLAEDLQEKHSSFRMQIDSLVAENGELRRTLSAKLGGKHVRGTICGH